jgi:hypothetical protein
VTESQGQPDAGWYADPSGQAGVRWWDGGQWTAHTAPMPTTGPMPIAAEARPRLPDTTPVYTPFIWIYVLLPLVPVIGFLFWNPTLPPPSSSSEDPLRWEQESLASLFTPAYFILIAVSLLSYVAMILMAFLDHRALRRAGVVRPFHWAWSFFVFVSFGLLAYPIGRSVVVRQVARPRGMAPVWVVIGVIVATFVISFVWSFLMFTRMASELPRTY